jgi:hypothetical protein
LDTPVGATKGARDGLEEPIIWVAIALAGALLLFQAGRMVGGRL